MYLIACRVSIYVSIKSRIYRVQRLYKVLAVIVLSMLYT